MLGLAWDDPYRIRTWQELVNWVKEVGFLPLFANEVEGFSAEEHTFPEGWFCGDPEQDPWAWREIIADSRQVAYGKFFGGRAGFISLEWLPFFVNSRRSGYDFDARWEDGKASLRAKRIMDLFIKEEEGESLFGTETILSTDVKKLAGFGKDGEKNFPGIVTQLQMELYLVIGGFRRRRNKRGGEYGMPVSGLIPPESLWGYETVTSAYREDPKDSWQRLILRVKEEFPGAAEKDIRRLIGREPEEA